MTRKRGEEADLLLEIKADGSAFVVVIDDDTKASHGDCNERRDIVVVPIIVAAFIVLVWLLLCRRLWQLFGLMDNDVDSGTLDFTRHQPNIWGLTKGMLQRVCFRE